MILILPVQVRVHTTVCVLLHNTKYICSVSCAGANLPGLTYCTFPTLISTLIKQVH